MSRMLPKEFKQLLRDPRSARMLFVGPLVQLVIFGYAVTTDVRHVRTLVADLDRTAQSRQLVDAITASGYFDIMERADRPAQIVDALDHGRVIMSVEIPHGFSADIAAGRQAQVQLLVDGSSANTANVALGYANQIISRCWRCCR